VSLFEMLPQPRMNPIPPAESARATCEPILRFLARAVGERIRSEVNASSALSGAEEASIMPRHRLATGRQGSKDNHDDTA
jgi:hypothetical protein